MNIDRDQSYDNIRGIYGLNINPRSGREEIREIRGRNLTGCLVTDNK